MSLDTFSMEHEVALVTGGGTGIGFGIAQAFAEAGARVVIAGRREDVLRNAVRELGDRVSHEVYDVTETAGAPELLARIGARVGEVTVLVNNAGIHLKKPVEDVTEEEFLRVLQVHLIGAHALSRAAIPGMRRAGRGSIVFIASMASLFGIPWVVAYSAAKSAHLGMVRTMAVELGKDGIRVNAIAPGWIESDMQRKSMEGDPERKARVLGRTALGRFGNAQDIGNAAVYLSSPAGRFVTGTCLAVDGGVSIGF